MIAALGLPLPGIMLDAALVAQSGGSFWMPPEGSTAAPAVDFVFNYLLAISAFFFVLIVVLMVVFAIVYRRRPGVEPGQAPSHSTVLELTWTFIPVALVVSLFYFGFQAFMEMKTPPRNAYEIRVTGQKWSWLFTYPDGTTAPVLHVPVNRPVRLTMTSEGIFGQTHTFSNAPPTKVDDNYIRESILDPMAKIRQGFQGVMPTFKGRLKDQEITAIIEYIKTLQ